MEDTEYLLCLKGHRECTLQFQINSCAVLEKHQQDLSDGGGSDSDLLQHNLPRHATQKAGHAVVLPSPQFPQLKG